MYTIFFPLEFESLGVGISFDILSALGGKEIASHDTTFGFGTGISGTIGFTKLFALQAGLAASYASIGFETTDSGLYSSGPVSITFLQLRIPVTAKFRYPLGPGILSAGAGFDFSLFPVNQVFRDDILTDTSRFLKPAINIGIIAEAGYGLRLGPGMLTGGVRFTISLLEYTYQYNTNIVHTGRMLSISPLIAYSFPLRSHEKIIPPQHPFNESGEISSDETGDIIHDTEIVQHTEGSINTGLSFQPLRYRIYFEARSDELTETGKATLEEIAEILAEHPGVRLTLTGYSAPFDTAEDRQKMAWWRAETCRKFLVQDCKIDTERLTVLAGTATADSGGTLSHRRMRYVEIQFELPDSTQAE
ncbi:OmpA family protein [Brucepastera parasyntrophica]|uniref:OmpA family protein n=1 Tax=Brucepastera parasyntrophica TaxID=2880008 RepID=UPI00210A4F80|nr:OmpA family protein [Brucepastera parasyntrophica]ULQ59630.1 OmpA family protein [Brucepastera parasyntrophica]